MLSPSDGRSVQSASSRNNGRAYVANDFKLPAHPGQEEAFDEIMRHSVRNLGTDLMSEQEVEVLERALHSAFMQLLDLKMGLATKSGLTGRYAMGGNRN